MAEKANQKMTAKQKGQFSDSFFKLVQGLVDLNGKVEVSIYEPTEEEGTDYEINYKIRIETTILSNEENQLVFNFLKANPKTRIEISGFNSKLELSILR